MCCFRFDVQAYAFECTNITSGIHSCKPSTRRAPTKAEMAVLGTQHLEHLLNTLVDLMASNDDDECLREALAVALVVFLTYEKQYRARIFAE